MKLPFAQLIPRLVSSASKSILCLNFCQEEKFKHARTSRLHGRGESAWDFKLKNTKQRGKGQVGCGKSGPGASACYVRVRVGCEGRTLKCDLTQLCSLQLFSSALPQSSSEWPYCLQEADSCPQHSEELCSLLALPWQIQNESNGIGMAHGPWLVQTAHRLPVATP